MKANLDHKTWVAEQFKVIRRTKRMSYRNAVLHATFIEGIVRKECSRKKAKFYEAIEWLFGHKKITQVEKEAFHAVRDVRNNLIHDIIILQPSQAEIEAWRDGLIKNVLKAYATSAFLRTQLSQAYNITWPQDRKSSG